MMEGMGGGDSSDGSDGFNGMDGPTVDGFNGTDGLNPGRRAIGMSPGVSLAGLVVGLGIIVSVPPL
jgi:hypothetical protein